MKHFSPCATGHYVLIKAGEDYAMYPVVGYWADSEVNTEITVQITPAWADFTGNIKDLEGVEVIRYGTMKDCQEALRHPDLNLVMRPIRKPIKETAKVTFDGKARVFERAVEKAGNNTQAQAGAVEGKGEAH